MTNPTDSEIIALADETRTAEGSASGYILPISFARAVLAKWGMPQADYDHGPQSKTVQEAARHVGKWLNERPNRPLDLRDVAMLSAHAQAQAGAVPLTDEQIVGVMHSIPINAAPSYHIAFARAIEQAHGLKGGQHGTE